MDDEVHGLVSEGVSEGPATGVSRKVWALVAASAVVGVVAGAALMHSWDHNYLLFPPSPLDHDLQVEIGGREAWMAVPDRGPGVGGVAIIPLVLMDKGKQPIILNQVQVGGIATKLSTDSSYDITGQVPETLSPGVTDILSVPVAFDCFEGAQPNPIVSLGARFQKGAEEHIVIHPADLMDVTNGGVWGVEEPCPIRHAG